MMPAKKQKRGHIDEENMSNLLHRYPAPIVLALLKEVSQSADTKMDWNALVKKTATGITNPREYQMLWRHIAYCADLVDEVDETAEPLDDDSDLEFELEAYPAATAEDIAEAAACVKVLIGSGLPGDSKVPNNSTFETPLAINSPNVPFSNSSLGNSLPSSVQGTNMTVPVSLQKQPVPQGSVPVGARGEGLDVNGSTSTTLHPRKKKIPWTEEDDLELLAAVKKCGEGNWADIMKEKFKGDRTKPQLCQRLAIIKRRQSSISIGAQSTVGNGAATTSNPSMLNLAHEDNAAVNHILTQAQQSQSTPAGGNPISSKPEILSSKPEILSSAPNPRAPPKKALLKPVLESSTLAKVAVAAGARIASPSDASSLFKVAQANNAVHIMLKGESPSVKSSVTTNTSNLTPSTHLGPDRVMPFRSQPVRENLVRPTTPPTSSVPVPPATGSQPVRPVVRAGSHATGSQPVRPVVRAGSHAPGSQPVRPVVRAGSHTTGSQSVRPVVRPGSHATGSQPVRQVVRAGSHATGSQPMRPVVRPLLRPVVLPSPSSIGLASPTLPNSSSARLSQASLVVTAAGPSSQLNATVGPLSKRVEVKKEEKTSQVMKAQPPSLPLARPVSTLTVEARHKPSPFLSGAGLPAPTPAASVKNSQCSVNPEKGNSKDSCTANTSASVNKKDSLAEGKHGEP